MTLLSLQGVTKRFDDVAAVDDVSFSIDRGEVVGFLGPNGAGKSTTMRMITQYYEPDAGEVLFDGRPLRDASRQAKLRIGYLAENNPLYGEMLVFEYLDFVARLRGLSEPEADASIAEAVEATGVESVYYRPISELSKGYRQRVGLAQAILHTPDLLVLDEPTEGLDPNQRLAIRHLIGKLGKDRTIILSTHVLSEVQTTCSRLLVINRGRIVADGPVQQLVAQAEGGVQITIEVSGEGVPPALEALEGVVEVHVKGHAADRTVATLTVGGSRDVRPAIFELAKTEGWTLYELHQETASLEDFFRQLTAESE